MKPLTKKEAIARKAAWQKALEEGRVVRFLRDGNRMISYPTIAMRDEALAKLEPGVAEVVKA